LVKDGQRGFGKEYQHTCWDRKKNSNRFWVADYSKSHRFSEAVNGFQISPRMQQLMTYCGQLDSFEKSN